MLTVAEIASDLETETMDAEQAANRFRLLVRKEVIKPEVRMGSGRTAPKGYPTSAPAAAKVLFTLNDMGIEAKAALKSVWDALMSPAADGDQLAIDLILADIANPRDAENTRGPVLVITIFALPDGGDVQLRGNFRLTDQQAEPIVCPTDDHDPVGYLVLHLKDVLRNFAPRAS